MKTKIFLTAMIVVVFMVVASAQQKSNQTKAETKTQTFFVDENNDGVCDNYTGQGKHQRRGHQISTQSNNQKSAGLLQGKGKKNGKGNGQGRRINFVDANNNGICDNKE